MVHFHIFTNDLRYVDNDALAGDFVPIFHLNPDQVNGRFASMPAIKFMISCLSGLEFMNIFEGSLSEFVKFLISIRKPGDKFSIHKDYTKYSLYREETLPEFVELVHGDRFLTEPSKLLKPDGSAYISYGAFLKKAMVETRKPRSVKCTALDVKLPGCKRLAGSTSRTFDFVKLSLIETRDDMSQESMQLSKYMTFGCYSIREMYAAGGDEFKKQMVWREFYQCILMGIPRAREYTFLDGRFSKFRWQFVQSEWDLFMSCKTGVLLVDAAMRELMETSFMNNRARMIWATYCIKYMQIDPYDPEYGAIAMFSRMLVDCSTSQNKLNFEWIIGSLDLSGKRYAPAGVPAAGRRLDISNAKAIKKNNGYAYIRKWLPEYASASDKQLREVIPSMNLDERYNLWISKCRELPPYDKSISAVDAI